MEREFSTPDETLSCLCETPTAFENVMKFQCNFSVVMDLLKHIIPIEAYDNILRANLCYMDILTESDIYLSQLTKLPLKECNRLVSEVTKIFLKTTFKPAATVPEWTRLATGCDSIDKIIRHGIPINGITEVVGSSGVGKTQLCLQLSVMVQLPVTLGGLGKGAVYISTEDIFPSKRLLQLSDAFSSKYPQLNLNYMDNVFLEHISNFEQLQRCCTIQLPKFLQRNQIGLIIIDSIAGIFRSENISINYVTRSRQLYKIVSTLTKLSSDYKIAVVHTNQVIDNVDTGKLEPCLGIAWSNLVTCRFWIHRFLGSVRFFEVVFAPDLANTSCKFEITSSGLISLDL